MINNFEQIKRILKFEDDEFYHIQIIKRRKDTGNENMKSGQLHIKTYTVSSINYLNSKEEEIIDICLKNNARAYINLNVKTNKQVAYKMLQQLSNLITSENYNCSNLYNSCISKCKSSRNKSVWIIDIDEDDIKELSVEKLQLLEATIQQSKPDGNKFIDRIETKNGVHILTTVFDTKKLIELFPNIEIKKNSPTILFCN